MQNKNFFQQDRLVWQHPGEMPTKNFEKQEVGPNENAQKKLDQDKINKFKKEAEVVEDSYKQEDPEAKEGMKKIDQALEDDMAQELKDVDESIKAWMEGETYKGVDASKVQERSEGSSLKGIEEQVPKWKKSGSIDKKVDAPVKDPLAEEGIRKIDEINNNSDIDDPEVSQELKDVDESIKAWMRS